MRTGFKVCGLTRAADAAEAVGAGADFIGVVFAGGPRLVTPERAASVLAEMPRRENRVGVFGSQGPGEIARLVETAGVGVVQLHNDPDPAAVVAVRESTGLAVWAVVRVAPGSSAPDLSDLYEVSDAVLLDARSPSGLGGTGTRLSWNMLGSVQQAVRPAETMLVLAGGLSPGNVAEAVMAVQPDLVDVSSGVEQEPGIKDPVLIRAFARAVRMTTNRDK